jgi:hypothetical protein
MYFQVKGEGFLFTSKVLAYPLFEFFVRIYTESPEHSAGHLREEHFDQVQPGSVYRSKDEFKSVGHCS